MRSLLLVTAGIFVIVSLAVAKQAQDTAINMLAGAAVLGLLSMEGFRDWLRPSNMTGRKLLLLAALILLGVSMVKFGPVTVFNKISNWIQEAIEGAKKGQSGT